MSDKKNNLTPMMEQYSKLKKENPNGFLFYRMGDFYEMFDNDAVEASKILNITLTKRSSKSDIPMAGIPYHAAENYIGKLVSLGNTVVICEQVGEVQSGKIVNREVERIITPSTASDESIISPNKNIILASAYLSNGYYSIVELNVSNGDFVFHYYSDKIEFYNTIKAKKYSEILMPEDFLSLSNEINGSKIIPDSYYNFRDSAKNLKKINLIDDKYLRKNLYKSSISAANSIVLYIESVQSTFFSYAKSLVDFNDLKTLKMSQSTIKHLELLKNNDGYIDGTLYSTLNYTTTSMGSRKLKEWITKPSCNKKTVKKRLDIVESIIFNNLSNDFSLIFEDIPDVERILTRTSQKIVKPRDLELLANTIKKITELKEMATQNIRLKELTDNIPDCQKLLELLDSSINKNPPALIKDGGVIKDGYSKELDELKNMSENISDTLFDIEERERIRTSLDKFKISYNKIIGFYISIPKGKLKYVPEHYILKQSLTNENRYTIIELKNLEEKLITANSKALTKEKILYSDILDKISKHLKSVSVFANIIAELDVLNSFALVSSKNGYCKPNVFCKNTEIVGGRHPVIEGNRDVHFTPNGFNLKDKKLILLTGPNMGGKSTYMRQNAIIYIMAYMGCFVPAEIASIKETDQIFTRIGSGDSLYDGVSTFMVEMKEGASILKNATEKSLVLIDEIGRGTSTYDGLSIAWAFADRLSRICDTIFSTHYFELIEIEKSNNSVVNMYMKTTTFKNEIIFLHKIDYGYIDQSYGLVVAKNAGVDKETLDFAEKKLEELKRK